MPSDNQGQRRVYVGGLPSQVSNRELEDFFREFGKIRDSIVKNGYAFVEFDNYKDAEDAVYELNDTHWDRRKHWRLKVELARDDWKGRGSRGSGRGYGGYGRSGGQRGNPPARSDYRMIVENLSSRTSWQDLKDHFRKAGEIAYANVNTPYYGEGVVEFKDNRDLEYALDNLDKTELHGNTLKVFEDKRSSGGRKRSRSESSRSRSRSKGRRSKSHSKDRSRSRSRGRRSKSHSKDRSRSRSRSERSRSKSNAHSRSRSPRKQKKQSKERYSRSRSVSRDRSNKKSNSNRRESEENQKVTSNGRRSRSGSKSDDNAKEK